VTHHSLKRGTEGKGIFVAYCLRNAANGVGLGLKQGFGVAHSNDGHMMHGAVALEL